MNSSQVIKTHCQAINGVLSTFKPYTPKQKSRIAYEVKESDQLIESSDERFGILKTDKGLIQFTRNIEFISYQVFPGDFIEIIKWPNVAVHWPRSQFEAQNITANDTVIQRGDAVFEEGGAPGEPLVCSTVIKVKDRYFVEIKDGRVLTAAYIDGATRYRRIIDEDKKRNKALAELTARKRNPQLLEIGFWSREIAEVQGGAV